jgi:vacuolar-type H+-ATPase subunit D/Vma8
MAIGVVRAVVERQSRIGDAAREFERLVEQVLDAAPQEHMMRRLGQALLRTTRLVNTLEQRVAVRLMTDLAEIRRTLSEREREEHLRIKRLIARRHAAASDFRAAHNRIGDRSVPAN